MVWIVGQRRSFHGLNETIPIWLRDLKEAEGQYPNVYGDHKLQAISHLGEVIYPDDDIEKALKPFKHSDNPDWRKAAQKTVRKIREIQA